MPEDFSNGEWFVFVIFVIWIINAGVSVYLEKNLKYSVIHILQDSSKIK